MKSKSVFFQDGISLHLDSYGQLFLKCVSNVYFLYEELDGILSTEMNKAEFESSIEPLVIGDEEVKIYSSFDPTFPEFNYYLQNGSDQNVKDIYTITDSVLMHTFRAQYRDLSPRSKLEAYRSELETGIDKEIISGYMAGFHNSIYFKPPYAPIFKLDSGYLVVDIPSSKMVFLNKEGEVLNAIKVSFHEQSKAKGWKNLMVQDGITNSVYVVYEKNGIVTLNLLDLKSAAPSSSSKLTYKYPEKIKIKDGYIYYLYRPFESSQKHYLYKEKLKNSL